MPSLLKSGAIVPWDPVYLIPNAMDWTSWVLSLMYLTITIWPLVQLVRLQRRIPGGPWTTQRMFFLLSVIANLVRVVFFALVPFVRRKDFFGEHDVARYTVFTILDDIPCDVYFTTYTLLILFWAEVIQHAKDRSSETSNRLRPLFIATNTTVYVVQIVLWILISLIPTSFDTLDLIGNIFFTLISLVAAGGFVLYGGRLYFMLKSFPIESKSRQRKLREVGLVAAICTTCFVVRSALLIVTMSGPMELSWEFILMFFLAVEVLPSALVLFMLRHLPSPRPSIVDTSSNYGTASDTGNIGPHRPLIAAVVPTEGSISPARSSVKRWYSHSLNS